MNLLLLGAVSLPVGYLAYGFGSLFVPPKCVGWRENGHSEGMARERTGAVYSAPPAGRARARSRSVGRGRPARGGPGVAGWGGVGDPRGR